MSSRLIFKAFVAATIVIPVGIISMKEKDN